MKNKDNDIKKAIALEYDPEDEAPRVVASGRGALAERIIKKAEESNVPIHQDDKLADTLSRLDIGDMIPPELYNVVAEVLGKLVNTVETAHYQSFKIELVGNSKV